MPIYTKSGDKGYTSALSGKRLKKSAGLIEFLGCLDEFNVWLGFVVAECCDYVNNKDIKNIQHDLFLLGSVVSGYKVKDNFYSYLNQRVSWLESEIDAFESNLPKLNKFIVPGGNKPSLYIHYARVLCRRCERKLVSLNKHLNLVPYLNRLSDYLFVLARFVYIKQGLAEELADINFDQL